MPETISLVRSIIWGVLLVVLFIVLFKYRKSLRNLKKSKEALEEMKMVLEVRVRARTRELKELTQNLEGQVTERTSELQERVNELERFHRLTVGREMKMAALKRELRKLKGELEKCRKSRKAGL